jgi:dGTPase
VALRGLINELVTDLIETTWSTIHASGVTTLEDVRGAGRSLAGLSPHVATRNRTLKAYLRTHLYQHHRIERMKDKASRVLRALCERYLENPRLLPDDARHRTEVEGVHRAIADYVAGMTDRYASEEYQRLFDPTLRV